MVQAAVEPGLIGEYEEQFAGSQRMHQRAAESLAGGIAHDGRFIKPFPIYIDRAQGAYKWDVDGNRLIDYAMGHGSLILGHNHPEVMAAVHEASTKGTHFGAGHEAEIKWAEKVTELVPSAQLVRFTASGTEATLLAMRLARAYSGKPSILKFEGHFHGWNDYLIKGEKPPFESPGNPGVPDEVGRTVAVLPSDDLGMVEERLSQGDIAAIIIEPSGGSWSSIPLEEDFLKDLREIATRTNTILIFDEVITGFRVAPGGAQELLGVTADLAIYAKAIGGGFPVAALTGRRDLMELAGDGRVLHGGTYNTNLVSTAAAHAVLETVHRDGATLYPAMEAQGARLLEELRSLAAAQGIPLHVQGLPTVFNTCFLDVDEITDYRSYSRQDAARQQAFLRALQAEGVRVTARGTWFMSAAHGDTEIDRTLEAAEASLAALSA
jgi:glutamate-1-semialdehyde 2,1-aminomutase